jgi:hypothetical protein
MVSGYLREKVPDPFAVLPPKSPIECDALSHVRDVFWLRNVQAQPGTVQIAPERFYEDCWASLSDYVHLQLASFGVFNEL